MRVMLCTLCLNEMEWLPKLYEQHKLWPELLKWVFVESADRIYAQTNPRMVTKNGLSVDGTTEFLEELARKDDRIVHIKHGFCGIEVNKNTPSNLPLDQGKCEARQRYLDVAHKMSYSPEILVVLDADEFYTLQSQRDITHVFDYAKRGSNYKGSAVIVKQRHIWNPPSIQAYPGLYPLFSQEVIGGYWDVPHCRIWKYEPGIYYKDNHNWPQKKSGEYLLHSPQRVLRLDLQGSRRLIQNNIETKLKAQGEDTSHIHVPECVHMGYASNKVIREAKHAYYINRGEGNERTQRLRGKRGMYVDCRNAWLYHKIGETLPHGAKVIPYKGEVPEVFIEPEPELSL